MLRFALGFAAALLALVIAAVLLPVDVSVRAISARHAKPMVPELIVPMTAWCVEDAEGLIAKSNLEVEIERIEASRIFPFVTEIARVPTAENGLVSPEGGKKAFDLLNALIAKCLPENFLVFRGEDATERAVATISGMDASEEKHWLVLEIDPPNETVRMSLLPGDIRKIDSP